VLIFVMLFVNFLSLCLNQFEDLVACVNCIPKSNRSFANYLKCN